jgi:hypothetical protein
MFHFETSANAAKHYEQRTATRNRTAVRSGQSLPTTKVTRQCLYSSLTPRHTHAAWFYRTSLLSCRTVYLQNEDPLLSPVLTYLQRLNVEYNCKAVNHIMKVPTSNNTPVIGCQLRLQSDEIYLKTRQAMWRARLMLTPPRLS